MEGRGTTNYSSDKPSFAFSTRTTEFDDALISRGIVSFEQAMLGKGASPMEAMRLTREFGSECDSANAGTGMQRADKATGNRGEGDANEIEEVPSDGSIEGDEDGDKFMERYRRKRVDELKRERKGRHSHGEVIPISRPDWNREVNDASLGGRWVVVNLIRSGSSHSVRHDAACDAVEGAIRSLARKCDDVKFASIASTSAIENWPIENLPTLFCYRDGTMLHQLVGVAAFGGAGVNLGRVEWRLAGLGVLETNMEEDAKPDEYDRIVRADISKDCRYGGNSMSHFGGVMSQLATTREDGSDYDDVD